MSKVECVKFGPWIAFFRRHDQRFTEIDGIHAWRSWNDFVLAAETYAETRPGPRYGTGWIWWRSARRSIDLVAFRAAFDAEES